MNTWIKIAAGVITGLAVVGAMCASDSRNKKNAPKIMSNENEIPDEILDGPLPENKVQEKRTDRSKVVRQKAEAGMRQFQDGLGRVSTIIGDISIIVTSILRIIYEEPYNRISTSTYIY